MIRTSGDKLDYGSLRIHEIQYDANNENDRKIIQEIVKLVDKLQPTCFNCEHHYLESSFGEYMISMCDIHDCLECYRNPHNDRDGSKCKDYRRKKDD